jgi:hypothetical protein
MINIFDRSLLADALHQQVLNQPRDADFISVSDVRSFLEALHCPREDLFVTVYSVGLSRVPT